MATIGEMIQRLRKQQRATQSDLAEAVGVSTQAVSKWECGGTPDALLLPAIADFFHVSIDHLFGREHVAGQELSSYVFGQISKLRGAKRNQECFRLIYALSTACSEISDIASVMKSEEMELFQEDTRIGYQMATDDTLALMTLMASSPYAVFLPEPEQGYLGSLSSAKEYAEFFTFLSKPHCMEIIVAIYQRINGFTISLLSKLLHLEEAVILPIIQKLVELTWLVALDIDTEETSLPVYVMDGSIAILPFLLLSREMFCKINVGYTLVTREKPILYHNERNDEAKTKTI